MAVGGTSGYPVPMLAALLTLALLTLVPAAEACFCVQQPVDEALAAAEVVVEGPVVFRKRVRSKGDLPREISIRADTIYKDTPGLAATGEDLLVLFLPCNSGTPGPRNTFIWFIDWNGTNLVTSYCRLRLQVSDTARDTVRAAVEHAEARSVGAPGQAP